MENIVIFFNVMYNKGLQQVINISLTRNSNFAEEWLYWHPILIKKSMLKVSRRESLPIVYIQLLKKQHNQGSTMLSSQSIAVHLVNVLHYNVFANDPIEWDCDGPLCYLEKSCLYLYLIKFVESENLNPNRRMLRIH